MSLIINLNNKSTNRYSVSTFNYYLKITYNIMSHIYFFKSSEERDGLSCLTIMSSSLRRAYGLAVINFIKNGYKGYPVRLAI